MYKVDALLKKMHDENQFEKNHKIFLIYQIS